MTYVLVQYIVCVLKRLTQSNFTLQTYAFSIINQVAKRNNMFKESMHLQQCLEKSLAVNEKIPVLKYSSSWVGSNRQSDTGTKNQESEHESCTNLFSWYQTCNTSLRNYSFRHNNRVFGPPRTLRGIDARDMWPAPQKGDVMSRITLCQQNVVRVSFCFEAFRKIPAIDESNSMPRPFTIARISITIFVKSRPICFACGDPHQWFMTWEHFGITDTDRM